MKKASKAHTRADTVLYFPNILGEMVPHVDCVTCGVIESHRVIRNGVAYDYCPVGYVKPEYGSYIKLSYCECCGDTGVTMVVHHITGNKSFEADEDLRTMCEACHNRAEALVKKLLKRATPEKVSEFTTLQNKGFFTKDFWTTSTVVSKRAKY